MVGWRWGGGDAPGRAAPRANGVRGGAAFQQEEREPGTRVGSWVCQLCSAARGGLPVVRLKCWHLSWLAQLRAHASSPAGAAPSLSCPARTLHPAVPHRAGSGSWCLWCASSQRAVLQRLLLPGRRAAAARLPRAAGPLPSGSGRWAAMCRLPWEQPSWEVTQAQARTSSSSRSRRAGSRMRAAEGWRGCWVSSGAAERCALHAGNIQQCC